MLTSLMSKSLSLVNERHEPDLSDLQSCLTVDTRFERSCAGSCMPQFSALHIVS